MASPSLGALSALLRKSQRLVITSHIQPDGDSIGSSLALAWGLEKLGKQVRILHPDSCPEKYRFLDPHGRIEVVREGAALDLAGADLGVLLDASDPARVGKLKEAFFKAPFPKVCIDHHVSSPRSEFLLHHACPKAAATASLVLQVLDLLQVSLEPAIASALFVGLSTDTGWFRYSNTSARVFREAARFIQAGADAEALFSQIYETFSLARIRLEGVVLERIHSEFGGSFLWSYLDRRTIEAVRVPLVEFDGLIDPLRTIRGGKIMALFYEIQPEVWKVSFRSRGEVDVEAIATRLGGGGHVKAAGCNVKGTLEAVEKVLRQEVAKALGT